MHRVELKAPPIWFSCWVSPPFLMHRVELKGTAKFIKPIIVNNLFLMHRVELKASPQKLSVRFPFWVPNAPCGVESVSLSRCVNLAFQVPNAPCGVESLLL